MGRIAALGANTPSIWQVGQRVGVGRLGGYCNECVPCRQGRFQLCQNQPFVGATCDGGYAEMMLARATGLVSIPDELNAEEAAPILCAGIATFNALKKCGAQAGDIVAIVGIGGLGHMALQYARKMGSRLSPSGAGATSRTMRRRWARILHRHRSGRPHGPSSTCGRCARDREHHRARQHGIGPRARPGT
ncbi:alcohol dehydrogenase catalytic domain-containing protein [Stutzerimonas stutzeri]|uniref:alcohol dehydrogenase catalytic domain-containing protein n=1 Tax=Stutzerimonas stutzeri TaxID=316 RepID=UPI002A8113B5|nr:alcohol dehydrogenase catalytic domain-containing protein [Stutzerimonas stutzeri]